MRKLIAQQFVTLDNIAAENDGGMSFVGDYGVDWNEAQDQSFKAEALRFMDEVDTMILGATTYKMFAAGWPDATNQGEFGDRLNGLRKYVASRTLTEAPWGDWSAATITADPAATVRELKHAAVKDIVLWGSLTLMRDLADENLIDEYYLRICPATRGEGVRLFNAWQDLTLLEAKAHDRGMITARYVPVPRQ